MVRILTRLNFLQVINMNYFKLLVRVIIPFVAATKSYARTKRRAKLQWRIRVFQDITLCGWRYAFRSLKGS
jgi:hypothetical protein